MANEEKHRPDQPAQPGDDLIVSVGNLSNAELEQVQINAEYEAMVEDYIGNFNHIVIQGVPPVTALMAFGQAFALVLGCCIRCGLKPSIGRKLIGMILKESDDAARNVQIATTQ